MRGDFANQSTGSDIAPEKPETLSGTLMIAGACCDRKYPSGMTGRELLNRISYNIRAGRI